MANLLKFILVSILLSFPGTPGYQTQKAEAPKPCQFLNQALLSYQQLKVGGTRSQVEKYFVPAGGLQFPSKGHYIYPMCPFLNLEVEFKASKPGELSLSKDDRITKISRLYVDYPTRD
jgi:hypothetical protein